MSHWCMLCLSPPAASQQNSPPQPLNVIAFLLEKQPPLQVLPILVSSPLLLPHLNFSPVLPLPVLNYTLYCEQGLVLFAL